MKRIDVTLKSEAEARAVVRLIDEVVRILMITCEQIERIYPPEHEAFCGSMTWEEFVKHLDAATHKP